MIVTLDRQPAMPKLPAWFMVALVLSIGVHLLLVSQLRLSPLPTGPAANQPTVLSLPPANLPAQPQTVRSRPPEPVTTIPEVKGLEQAVTPSTLAPRPASPPTTSSPAEQPATAPRLSPLELRRQLRRQTETDIGASEAPAHANTVWRDNGGYELPGSTDPDNVFSGRMHGITGVSGIKSVENYKDLNGFDQKVVELKNGTRLCGERIPPPNFEPFAASIFTWKKC